MKTISPQVANVYKLLDNGRTLNAQQIADELNVLPNTIYRATNRLVELGMIEQIDTYPLTFKALPSQTAINLYTANMVRDFRQEFGVVAQTAKTAGVPTISLLKDRESVLRRDVQDTRAAGYSIDFIVSGHEVPDETILAFRKAITVGVKVRMIIHRRQQAYSKQTKEWQNIGVDVRYLPDLDIRLFIYDKRIVYLTSFDAKNLGSAFGVRFDYPPLALQMSQLFEQNWQRATVIKF